MTVYLDVVFLENVIINYIILYATSIISKINIKQIKLIFGSLIGAIYSIIYYILNLKIYTNFIIKIILSIVIIYISFNPKSIKVLLKQTVLFYLVSFAFGGAAISIIYMVNSQDITIKNGVLVGKYTIKTILIGIIIAYFTVIIAEKIISSKIKLNKKDMICNISVEIEGKKIETKAMYDTGNFLKEPISNLPVIVIEYTLLYDIIPSQILNNLEKILGGDLSDISEGMQKEYISKLRVIPFSSLGKKNGMLLGIRAKNLIIEFKDEYNKIEDLIVGIYGNSLTNKGEYRCLI